MVWMKGALGGQPYEGSNWKSDGRVGVVVAVEKMASEYSSSKWPLYSWPPSSILRRSSPSNPHVLPIGQDTPISTIFLSEHAFRALIVSRFSSRGIPPSILICSSLVIRDANSLMNLLRRILDS